MYIYTHTHTYIANSHNSHLHTNTCTYIHTYIHTHSGGGAQSHVTHAASSRDLLSKAAADQGSIGANRAAKRRRNVSLRNGKAGMCLCMYVYTYLCYACAYINTYVNIGRGAGTMRAFSREK